MHTVNVVLICCLLAVTSGCEKHTSRRSESQDTKPRDVSRSISRRDYETTAAKFDVCGLLSKEEIHGVTGSSITQNLSSGRSDGSLRTSQCVYVADPANRSISLVVTQADSLDPRKRNPKDLWGERFGRYREQSEENKETVQTRMRRRAIRTRGWKKNEKCDRLGKSQAWEKRPFGQPVLSMYYKRIFFCA